MTAPLQAEDDGPRQEEEDTSEVVETQEDAEQEEKHEETEEQDTEERAVVELDEREEKEEDSDDEVQFVRSAEGSNCHQETEEKQEEDEVVIVESGPPNSYVTQRSKANTDAIMAANGYVTSATLEAELQCIICQYAMFKPMSAVCGHSFCRVCLMDSLLTRPIEEAQCPICRIEVLKPISSKMSLESIFYVNVTLWNLVQLLIPSIAERISTYQDEEEREYKQKLRELETKWTTFTLEERAAIYHGDHDDDEVGSPARWEEDHEGHEDYPVLKVEDTHDGDLHVSRNIVLDTSDENEDGVMNMRVGIAIVEFPSIFELYNEHQECSVNVIKMEEDEETADGMPFFMNEDGDDDGFVCGSYYNEISLRVCDEAGNCVMERTRGARGGVVTFPGLRLDVPGGLYTFRFSDDLYGLKLSITTHLREPHEISDTPVADYVSLINDEARDGSRRNRRRNHDSDNDYDEEGNESDDSFIVDDLNHEPVGRFSDDEGEDHWEYHSDDEAADEEREQRRVRRRQRSGRRSERDVEVVDEHQEGEEFSDSVHEEDEEVNAEVQPGRRNIRIVDDAAFSSDGENEREEHDAEEVKEEEEDHETLQVSQPRRRNANQIIDSDDEDDETAPVGSDEEEKESEAVSGGPHEESVETELGDEDIKDGTVVNDHDEAEDTADQPTRKVKRSQWFQDESDEEDCEPHPDASFSSGDHKVVASRPLKRSRGRERQVRVIDEGLSDEGQEELERAIIVTNTNAQDDDSDAGESDSQFRRVHLYDEDENVDLHGYEDAHQDNEADYPDEDDYQEEEDI